MPRFPLCHHRFVLSGLNLERFINTLHKEKLPLLSARRTDPRTLVCECYSRDLPAISAIAQEKGWRMRQAHPIRLSALLAFLKRRPGLLIGCAAALALVLTLSRFVWRVELHGAGAYQADMRAYLEEIGCGVGTPRASVDASALEKRLTYRYPEIAWFHAYVSGMTLVVDVSHGVAMPELPSHEPADVIALRDGVVDSVRVYAGTAQVRAGDTVRRGQVLIRGEERREDGTTESVHAFGEVIARCWHTETVRMPLYEVHSWETGRETVQARLHTPWLSLPAEWETPDFLAYNAYLEAVPIAGAFFPVTLQRMRYRECAMEYVPRDEDEVRSEALEAASKRLKSELQGDEIIDKWADYCMIEDEILAVSVTAEWLMDIGGAAPP